jgi:hypothetical protein
MLERPKNLKFPVFVPVGRAAGRRRTHRAHAQGAWADGPGRRYWKIFTALRRVMHTPQASGKPSSAQATRPEHRSSRSRCRRRRPEVWRRAARVRSATALSSLTARGAPWFPDPKETPFCDAKDSKPSLPFGCRGAPGGRRGRPESLKPEFGLRILRESVAVGLTAMRTYSRAAMVEDRTVEFDGSVRGQRRW